MSQIKKDQLPKRSLNDLKDYYDYLWAKSKGIKDEFLKEIPDSLRTDILQQRYYDAV